MLAFIKANIYNIITIAILAIIIALIINNLVKKKKSGKGSCGGDCSSCGVECNHLTASKYITTLLVIDGMSCGMCEAHINDVVRREFKVKSVHSSHKNKTCEIVSNEPLDEEKLKKVIGDTGYTVKAIHSTANAK